LSSANLIFVGGQVVTVDPQNRIVSAVAVRGNRIVCVGSDHEALTWKGPHSRVIDLKGKTMTPGLIEERIKEAAQNQPPGTWIRGRGYTQNKLDEQRHPTRVNLDAVAPNHPVVLTRTCGQIDRDEQGRPNGVLRETAAEPVWAASSRSLRRVPGRCERLD
jgi:predicted amidohydrolase YtcJ